MDRVSSFLTRLIRAAVKPRPLEIFWQWLDRTVRVPLITGSRFPGALDTGLMPPVRGLYEKYANPRVHFFTFIKSARVGGTLFCICLILEKIGRWPGPILYMAPTARMLSRFSQTELQPHMQECPPVAEVIIPSKTHWTRTEMILKVCTVGLVSAGSVNQLAGRQGELVIIDEADKVKTKHAVEAPPTELVIVRTKQFVDTRKVVRAGTPTRTTREMWINFLAGSQEYCYVACPKCATWQRLTFFREAAEPDRWMRVDANDPILKRRGVEKKASREGSWLVKGVPATGRVWWPEACRDAQTKVWDVDRVEKEAAYECVHCQHYIPQDRLGALTHRYHWRAHNPDAPADHVSVQFTALYSIFERIGALAKKYLQAVGSAGKMQDFYNSDLGLPFEETGGRVDAKTIERLIKSAPEAWLTGYTRGGVEGVRTLPFKPAVILMACDVQAQHKGFWWVIFAIDLNFNLYVLDWGPALGFDDLERFAALTWEHDGVAYGVMEAAIDMGHRTTEVYEFCINTGLRFKPFQGRHVAHGLYQPHRFTGITYEGWEFTLTQFLDALWKDELYIRRIGRRQGRGFYLPRLESEPGRGDGTDQQLIDQLSDEKKVGGVWESENDNNHLGDCLKEAVVLESLWQARIAEAAQAEADARRAAAEEAKSAAV